MYSLLILLSLPVFASAAGCDISLVCQIDDDCDGQVAGSCVLDPQADIPGFGCCPAATTLADDDTTTPVATATTATNSTTTKTCVDELNPLTGVSDCPARAYLCEDAVYYNVMTVECPFTCNRCPNITSSGCADLPNPLTGVPDCPARAYLCNDSTYYDVMTEQCPRTCGRCSNTTTTNSTSSSSCIDLTNINTGISDCPARKAYCNHTIYKPLMKIQCPVTCGFCTSG